jgi:hypothetical protein
MPHHPRKLAPLLALALLAGASLAPARAFAQDSAEPTDQPPPVPAESEAGPPPAEAVAPQRAPDQAAFQQALSPYGRWVDTPEYGRVWVPNDTTSPDWQPYTSGRWVWTAGGWAFVSTVPWGWAAYHYGRWGWRARLGWYWVPAYTWGPAWVSWRRVGVHYAWSPYAPAGYVYGRRWPGWVVVPRERFRAPVVAAVRLARPQAHAVLRGAQRPASHPAHFQGVQVRQNHQANQVRHGGGGGHKQRR